MAGAITDSRSRGKAGEAGGMRGAGLAPKPRRLGRLLSSLALAATIFGGCDGDNSAAVCEPQKGATLNRCKGVRTEQVFAWKDSSDLAAKATCFNAGAVFTFFTPSGCTELAKYNKVEGLELDLLPMLDAPGCVVYGSLRDYARVLVKVADDKIITIQMRARGESVDLLASCNEPNAGCDMRFTMEQNQVAELYFGERVTVRPDNQLLYQQVGGSPELGISINYITFTKDGKMPYFNINYVCLSKKTAAVR